ncbi:hypothetical protein MNBD_GAMMA06-1792 [hydrothermal vent metagenome]|uniref:Peptidase M10 metallopeptidase domain-containing protein n=1 Tax=hydrothermal vent metagenome TaxID=652676 RepID=A0A3B0WNF6_9ZZZZ
MLKPTLLISLIAYSSAGITGGPSYISGSNGITPVTYQNPNITIHVESGTFGPLSNSAANQLVSEAFDLWNNVNSSNISLSLNQTAIKLDINENNYTDYLPDVNFTQFKNNDNLNPLVYDNNGEIIDLFFGQETGLIVGFSASIRKLGDSYFSEGYTVINGQNFGLISTSFKLLIAHEIGHFFGLDHTQVNINNQETNFGSTQFCSTKDQSAYPAMYPFLCRGIETTHEEVTLHQDDISAVSALYPSVNIGDSFGILQGRFVDNNNNAILGANIWAENTTTGEVVSIVSDYLTQGTGFYKLYLPPGNYTLHANSINAQFYGGSSIGPYAEKNTVDEKSLSFLDPHPITEVAFQNASIGNNEVITVTTNQTQTIDFAFDGKAAIIPASNSGGGGVISHITALLLLSLWFGLRLNDKQVGKK